MHPLPPFQILPFHFVESIVHYVAGSSRLQFDDITNGSEEYAILLMPLLSVCRDCRAAVIERYCRIRTLDFTCSSGQVSDKMTLWPEQLRGIGFPAHMHARELDITLGVYGVYNGTALKKLLHVPHSDLLFSKIRTLKVTLTLTMREQRSLASTPAAQDIEPNIRAFVQRIGLMAPTTNRVCISLQSRTADEFPFVVQHFSSLVTQLGQLGNTIEHCYYCPPLCLEPPPTGISKLSYVDWYEDSDDLVMQLARNNAPTMQTLYIQFERTVSVSQLIQNADGSYVQYPSLYALRIGWMLTWTMEAHERQSLPCFPGAIPFPKLRQLTFKNEYIFGDDTPFRGNADTLEYLYLDLFPTIVEFLRERRIFTHGSHPRLQNVRIGTAINGINRLFDTDVSFTSFVLSIGPNARVREVDHSLLDPFPRSVIPVFGEHSGIQILNICWITLEFWDVIALINALPLLSDLYIRATKIDSLPSGIWKRKLPAYMIANHSPMGERFRCWRFGDYLNMDVEMVVKCVLFLALVCPNFDYAAVPAQARELFMAHMKKAIASNGFRQHATRLHRLLFGGWKNEIPSVETLDKKLAAVQSAS